MTSQNVFEKMKVNLQRLEEIDFGYPLGKNEVATVSVDADLETLAKDSCTKWLLPIYSVANGLSWPDVHVGYFVKPIERLMVVNLESEPGFIITDEQIKVKAFGSTGGGDLFVVRCDNGSVLLLKPGAIKNSVFSGQFKVVAKTIDGFLQALLSDLVAFVDDDKSHSYLA